jgi:hypothetical protein
MDTGFMATVNTPGYLPMEDDPPVFDTAQGAWSYLADEREREEDQAPDDEPVGEYTETLGYLRYAAGEDMEPGNPHEDVPLNADGTGVIYGPTPGYDGDHDLGLAYCVTAVFGGSVL